MGKNANLRKANKEKNDEFYTQYEDIEAEMNVYIEYNKDVFKDKVILCPCDDPEWSNFTKYFASNFERFGLKKLISTSYAKSSGNEQISKFEKESDNFDEEMHKSHGKVFILDRDKNNSGRIDYEDIDFYYLKGDGDFRSEEVIKLRDEADIIITNPPFSLFREFLAWIMDANKKFAIISNQNAITYKEVFPLIKDNKLWLGLSMNGSNRYFEVPDDYPLIHGKIKDGKKYAFVKGCRWFTNIDHGKRHEPLKLMTMKDNLKYNKKLKKKLEKTYGKLEYPYYDNYNAIEVPFSDAVPSDYDGVMGVPITFLDRYCPEQFEIINGIGRYACIETDYTNPVGTYGTDVNGKHTYFRILIRRKGNNK